MNPLWLDEQPSESSQVKIKRIIEAHRDKVMTDDDFEQAVRLLSHDEIMELSLLLRSSIKWVNSLTLSQ